MHSSTFKVWEKLNGTLAVEKHHNKTGSEGQKCGGKKSEHYQRSECNYCFIKTQTAGHNKSHSELILYIILLKRLDTASKNVTH